MAANKLAAPTGRPQFCLCRVLFLIAICQLVKEGNGTFGVGGGLNDGAGIILQHCDPTRDIAGMVRTWLNRQSKIGGQEGRT